MQNQYQHDTTCSYALAQVGAPPPLPSQDPMKLKKVGAPQDMPQGSPRIPKDSQGSPRRPRRGIDSGAASEGGRGRGSAEDGARSLARGPRWTAVDRGGPETRHFLTRGLKRISIHFDSHGLGLFAF